MSDLLEPLDEEALERRLRLLNSRLEAVGLYHEHHAQLDSKEEEHLFPRQRLHMVFTIGDRAMGALDPDEVEFEEMVTRLAAQADRASRDTATESMESLMSRLEDL